LKNTPFFYVVDALVDGDSLLLYRCCEEEELRWKIREKKVASLQDTIDKLNEQISLL
jgi:hypothetical protein